VKSALGISDDAVALESGRCVLHRKASELLAEPDIERLFLGGHVVSPTI
jgi:branched-chain amino acid transport system ATP-binding protein